MGFSEKLIIGLDIFDDEWYKYVIVLDYFNRMKDEDLLL